MRRPAHPVPAATLLWLGWRRLKVTCRDRVGHRTALHLRRRTPDVIDVELPGGPSRPLTNFEAGRFRAALREVLLGDHQPHRAEAT
jgi:hypothetical protein